MAVEFQEAPPARILTPTIYFLVSFLNSRLSPKEDSIHEEERVYTRIRNSIHSQNEMKNTVVERSPFLPL